MLPSVVASELEQAAALLRGPSAEPGRLLSAVAMSPHPMRRGRNGPMHPCTQDLAALIEKRLSGMTDAPPQ